MRRGHAVVGIKMPGANKVQKITIIPRGQAGGYNLMTPEEEKYNLTKKELIAMITSFMGGRAAEEIIYGKENVSTGASDDLHKATKIAEKNGHWVRYVWTRSYPIWTRWRISIPRKRLFKVSTIFCSSCTLKLISKLET
nr:hypothetical protein [Mycoplasmopsis bovis]